MTDRFGWEKSNVTVLRGPDHPVKKAGPPDEPRDDKGQWTDGGGGLSPAAAIDKYIGAGFGLPGGYSSVNKYLRTGEGAHSDNAAVIAGLDRAFAEAASSTSPKVLYRAMQFLNGKKEYADFAAQLQIGSMFHDKAFVSTTTSKDKISKFEGLPGEKNHGVVIRIRVPAGIRMLAGAQHESEVILDRSTSFKVVSKRESGGYFKRLDLTLEVVP